MNCVQCPECGTSEVPAQSNSCPDCGYPILTLSGFNIRERLREAAPEQATEANKSQPETPGVSKGKKLKSKFSRAKDALAKKGKSKKSLEEIVLPQLTQLPPEENEPSSNDPSESQQLEPEPPAEPQEQATLKPEVSADRITLAEQDDQPPQNVKKLEAIPEPDVVDPEPVATLNNVKVISEHEEKLEPALRNDVRSKPAPFAGFQLSAGERSPSTEAFQCYECGMEVDANANFCPYCRASLLRRTCPGCRRLVAGNTSFCAFCGTPATEVAEPPRNFATIFAVLIIVFTAVVIYLAKDFILEDPALHKNLAKVKTEKSTAPVPEQTNVGPPKRVDNLSPAKTTDDQQPGGTTEALPNKDGLIETTIGEDGSVQQDSIQQQPSQVTERGNQQEQSTQKPAPVVVTPKENAQRATTAPPAGFNSGQIAGVPSYKHRDAGLARYLNSVGYRLIRQRRYGEAVPILKRSVSYFPDKTKDIIYAYALFNLGHALRMSGHANEAIPVLEERMKIDNQRETVRRELAAARVAALRAPLR